MMKGLESKTYNSLGLFSLEKGRLNGDFISAYSTIPELFSGDQQQDPRKWQKAATGEVQVARKRFFNKRMVEHWNRLPKEVVMAPNFSDVQEASGQCYQTYGLSFGWSCVEPGVGPNDPQGPLPTQDIQHDSMILNNYIYIFYPGKVTCKVSASYA